MNDPQFQKQWLTILKNVNLEGIVIIEHGKPIPLESDSASCIGSLRGKLKIKGDIMSTGVTWHAES